MEPTKILSTRPSVIIITFILMVPSILFVSGQDPTVTKVADTWKVRWDFSDPGNYTFNNTTIDNGNLGLEPYIQTVGDEDTADFDAGNGVRIRVTPKGSLMLDQRTGTGFTEIGNGAKIDHNGRSSSVAWGDYDRDGLQDLFVGDPLNPNKLYHNNGDGTFTDKAVFAGVEGNDLRSQRAAIWGDYDNDGLLDLLTTTGMDLTIYHNLGNGKFSKENTATGLNSLPSTEGVSWLDYNGDGWLDLWQPIDGSADQLFQNNGDGTFTENASLAGVDDSVGFDAYVSVGDYNQDGHTDLLKSMEAGGVKLYKNDGDGTFTDTTNTMNLSGILVSKSGLVFSDVNNDALPDIYMGDDAQDLLYINRGNGFWEEGVASGMTENSRARGTTAADLDLDGNVDIFVANWGQDDILWHNNGDGSYTDMAQAWSVNGSGNCLGTGAADYDNDGDPDLYVACDNGPNLFYRNDFNTDGLIKFRLQGNHSNNAAIGARIEVFEKRAVDTLVGSREVTSGSGYGSTESLEQVFGVNRSILHKAIIYFSGGSSVTVDDIQAPSYLLVNESGQVTDLDLEHHLFNGGNFTSRPMKVGGIVSWGNISWNADVPPGTGVIVQTRTSPDGTSWSGWSGAYNLGDQIISPKDTFIQYWIELSTTDTDVGPEIFNLSIEYQKYKMQGFAMTNTFKIQPAALSMKFQSFGNNNGQSISFSYSMDEGLFWDPIPPNGDLSANAFHNITLRVELATNDPVQSPSLTYMEISFSKNKGPIVSLSLPKNQAIVAQDVTLEWNASDPDDNTLTFEVYLGRTLPYNMIAQNLTERFFRIQGLDAGTTYYWFVIAEDLYGARNLSLIRSFTVNSLPEIDLIGPMDNSILNITNVPFEWMGFDMEGQNLTYDLFIEIDGTLTNQGRDLNGTSYSLDLENQKQYRWYVIVDDGYLTNQSPIWSFTIDAIINDPPELTSTPPLTGELDRSYTHQFTYTDPDDDLVAFSFIDGVPVPMGMTITPGGYLMWTPRSSGKFFLGIQLDDGKNQVKYYFNITISSPPPNLPPTIRGIDDIKLKKDPVIIDLEGYLSDDGPLSALVLSYHFDDKGYFTLELDGYNLTITPSKDVKGTTSISIVTKDLGGLSAETSFNVTIDNKARHSSEEGDLGCLLLLLLIIALIIVVVFVIYRKRKARSASSRPESMETWNDMRAELYKDKAREDEEGPKFRGRIGPYTEEDLAAEGQQGREPLVEEAEPEAAPTSVYADGSSKVGPVFGSSMGELEPRMGSSEVLEPEPKPDEQVEFKREIPDTKVWTPAKPSEDTKVFTDEKMVKAQRKQDLDDIMSRLDVPTGPGAEPELEVEANSMDPEHGTPKTEDKVSEIEREGTEPKKKGGEASLDELLKKLRKD